MQSQVIVTTPEQLKEYIFECIATATAKNTPPPPVPTAKDDTGELLSRQEVRELLKVKSLVTVDNLTRKGHLQKHYLGSVVRFKRGEVIAFANQQKKRG